jgi:Cell division protein
MLDLVDDNPIPPFFRIKLDDRSKTPIDLIEVRKSIARDGVFEEVQAPVDWVNRIAEWKFKMVFWPVTICVLLLVTLSLIICNSVRLSLLSRKLLVENMKYAGGSTFFIQFPFVLEGLAQGLFGSVLAVIVLWMVVDAFTECSRLSVAMSTGLRDFVPRRTCGIFPLDLFQLPHGARVPQD